MKGVLKFLLCASICTQCMLLESKTAKTVEEQLHAAVQEGDVPKVKKYLRKLDRQSITPQEKKNILNRIMRVCDDSLDNAAARASHIQNPCDLLRIVGGAVVGIYALSHAMKYFIVLKSPVCTWCNVLGCGDLHRACKCSGCKQSVASCDLAKTLNQSQCTSNKISYYEGDSSKLWFSRKMVPYVGLAGAGFYVMYQGLTGAGHRAHVSSSKTISELLKKRADQ